MNGRILVVDDESVYELVNILTQAGFTVTGSAKDGEKAIELAYEQKPDLIVMNRELPCLNGLKASRIIYKAYRIPSVLLSSSDREEDPENEHVFGHLHKPLTEEKVILAVGKALDQVRTQRIYEKKVMVTDVSLQQRKSIEKAKGIIMRKRKVPEDKAYKLLRNLSTDKHLPIVEIAELIILKDDSAMLNK